MLSNYSSVYINLYAKVKAGNNNTHKEKMGIINFIIKQLEKNIDNPKVIDYIIRVFNSLPIEYINNHNRLQQRLYYLYAQAKVLTLIFLTKK
jgi:hypothetical protein